MAYMDSPLAVPQILDDTPSLVRTIVRGFEPPTLHWRPTPDRWSVAMVLAHLAEAEVTCFRTRLRRAATEACPVLEPYDQWAHLRDRTEFPIQETLELFERERRTTLKFLRALPSSVMTNTCRHQELGMLTSEHLLNEFAFHDMGHLRQILELCRAHAFYPAMGGWQRYYRVHP